MVRLPYLITSTKPSVPSSAPAPLRAAVFNPRSIPLFPRSSFCPVLFLSCPLSVRSGCQARRLHLMKQPPHPAIRDRGDDYAGRLPAAAELSGQSRPALLATDQSMGRFDQHPSQLVISRFDQPCVRL